MDGSETGRAKFKWVAWWCLWDASLSGVDLLEYLSGGHWLPGQVSADVLLEHCLG